MTNRIGDGAQIGQEKEDDRGVLYMKIKVQLEDLFSDSHLAEDGFLLKHVQRNKQGYVSLKLLTCLKRIKVLTTNWCTTLAAAEHSELLEVNDDCTKVRRKKTLPKWLQCSPNSKLLLAWNLPAEKTPGEDLEQPPLSEQILQKFSVYGSITSVWILRPGEELPKELQCYAKRHKVLGQHVCAVVKFDLLEDVRKAYSALKAEEKGSACMCVVPLGSRSMQNVTTDEPSEKQEDQPDNVLPQENPLETSEDSVQDESSVPVKVPDKTSDTFQPEKSLDNSMQRTLERISTSCSSQSFSSLNPRYSKRSWCSGDSDKKNSQSPWVLRRKFAASALNLKVAWDVNSPRVLRQPFGPDGTEGFRSRRKVLHQAELKQQ